MAFTLAPLPYAYDALEPVIDSQTMQLHHDKHHQTYVDKLNAAIAGDAELEQMSIEELLKNLNSKVPADKQAAVRNHGGGHYNHTLFWDLMTPGGASEPGGALLEALNSAFGDFATFKQQFSDKAAAQFGSGWAWLVVNQSAQFEILSLPNQDSPLTNGQTPVLGIDVWEHAYYLKYQNRRADYVTAWWQVVNWDKVAEKFASAS